MAPEPCPLPIPEGPDGLGVLVGSVRGEIVRRLEADLARMGVDLRFTQFLVLKRLAAMGTTSATELARAADMDGGAMTRLLDQLEKKGYLRRRPHEQDRRALRIELHRGRLRALQANEPDQPAHARQGAARPAAQ